MILGITGSFGSGKSTVARIFKSLAGSSAKIIDADLIAHQAIEPGAGVSRKVINIFGKGILKKNGAIDRAKLGGIVFQNRKLLHRLSAIIHPEVLAVIKKEIKANRGKTLILDVPLLLEAGMGRLANKVIVVKIKRQEQLKRLINKKGFLRNDILKRINSQMPLGEKIRLADFVINNNGDIRDTKKQAAKIWRLLWKN